MTPTISQVVANELRQTMGLERLPAEVKEDLITAISFTREELGKRGYLLPPPAASAFLVVKAMHSGEVPVLYRKDEHGRLRLSLFEDECDWKQEIQEL